MNLRTPAILAITIAVGLSLAVPVSAFYFEFFSFETDKLVYEVGETINMVANLIADFSQDGWCYVSFAVVTDHGPVFSDSYYISPSLNPRLFNSSFQIRPEDTSPGPDGTQTFVIFNVEIYDGYSQGGGDNIEVNLTRGYLDVLPLTPLAIESDSNTTLSFKICSSHSSDIVFANNPVEITLYNSTLFPVFQKNATTTSDGIIDLDWNSQIGPPGDYTISITSNETAAFHPLSKTLPIKVNPAFSNLTVVLSPESVYCQSPDGSHIDSAEIIVEHKDRNNQPITNSSIQYTTGFSSDMLSHIGGGQYRALILFQTNSGLCIINITTMNDVFMAANVSIPIEVLLRPITTSVQISESPVCGKPLSIAVQATDSLNGAGVMFLDIRLEICINQSYSDVLLGLTNESGHATFVATMPESLWGDSTVYISSNNTSHHTAILHSHLFEVFFQPTINHEVISPLVLGYESQIEVFLQDPAGNQVSGAYIEIVDEANITIANGISDSEGKYLLTWIVPITRLPGQYNLTIYIQTNHSKYIQGHSIPIQVLVHYPVHLIPSKPTWVGQRGTNFTIGFILDLEWADTHLISIEITDENGQISLVLPVFTDVYTEVLLSLAQNASLGIHNITIEIIDALYWPMDLFQLPLEVYGEINATITTISAYYSEGLSLSANIIDDQGHLIPEVDMRVYVDGNSIPSLVLENITEYDSIFAPLPSSISPGSHYLLFEIMCPWYYSQNLTLIVTIWIRTTIIIIIETYDPNGESQSPIMPISELAHEASILSKISSGSIMRPPPIFDSEITSMESCTTLTTSRDNCPRLSSGISNFSTELEKSEIIWSGNGHRVLNRRDLMEWLFELFVITSSTDRDVHP